MEEIKSNEVKKEEEPTSKYVYIQQSYSPTTMEEQVESDMEPTTNAVNEIAKNLSMMDETNTTTQIENHHKGLYFQLCFSINKLFGVPLSDFMKPPCLEFSN